MRQSVILGLCKTLVFSCLAIGLASTAEAQYGNPSSGVTLFRDLNFSGRSQTFTGDVSNLQGSYVGNDTATSVRIEPGCRARLYADADFRGGCLYDKRGSSDLRSSSVGNDTVSSMRVHCEGGDWGIDSDWDTSVTTPGVTLYRDLDFSGRNQRITDDISDLRGHYVGNDTATSVRIDPGCTARLYADANYQGSYLEVDRDISDLRGSSVGNDTVTSVRVRCEGNGGGWNSGNDWGSGGSGSTRGSATNGVTLYRDLNFSGRSQSFTSDISDLRGSSVGNDAATSVRVSRGCRARLFADANYRGAYIETERDISDLRGSPVGNDTVTSMQVRCEPDGGGWNSGGGWGSGDSSWGTSHRVSLYQHTNFRGSAYSFDSDTGDLRSMFGANDEASSVRVAPGCSVRLFQDPQFRGTYTETGRDISDLRNSRAGNDSISSLQVRCR